MTPMALVYVITIAVVMLGAVIAAAIISARHQQVVCPDNGQPVDVACEATGAVKTVFTDGHLRVKDCERWPEKADCDHACEKQLQR